MIKWGAWAVLIEKNEKKTPINCSGRNGFKMYLLNAMENPLEKKTSNRKTYSKHVWIKQRWTLFLIWTVLPHIWICSFIEHLQLWCVLFGIHCIVSILYRYERGAKPNRIQMVLLWASLRDFLSTRNSAFHTFLVCVLFCWTRSPFPSLFSCLDVCLWQLITWSTWLNALMNHMSILCSLICIFFQPLPLSLSLRR